MFTNVWAAVSTYLWSWACVCSALIWGPHSTKYTAAATPAVATKTDESATTPTSRRFACRRGGGADLRTRGASSGDLSTRTVSDEPLGRRAEGGVSAGLPFGGPAARTARRRTVVVI